MPFLVQFRFVFGLLVWGISQLAAQTAPGTAPVLREVSLRTDTAVYLLSRHTVDVQGVPTQYFWFRRDDETVELRLYPTNLSSSKPLRLRRSPDYQQFDSLTKEVDGGFRTRMRFQNLTSSRFL